MNDKDLARAAMEFVQHVANLEKADECRPVTGMYIPAARKLRQDADRLDKRDAMIDRARRLLLEFPLAADTTP